MIISQAFLYVIPALTASFLVVIVILNEASNRLEKEFEIKIDKYPSFDSCV